MQIHSKRITLIMKLNLKILGYKGKHFAVARCAKCEKILGAVPIPYEQYMIITTAYKAFIDFEKRRQEEERVAKKSKKGENKSLSIIQNAGR